MRQASTWDPAPGQRTFREFQTAVARAAGGVYVTQATGRWRGAEGFGEEPVFIVEALLSDNQRSTAYTETWLTFREYARQLVAQGEPSVLIVQDNEPTLIK